MGYQNEVRILSNIIKLNSDNSLLLKKVTYKPIQFTTKYIKNIDDYISEEKIKYKLSSALAEHLLSLGILTDYFDSYTKCTIYEMPISILIDKDKLNLLNQIDIYKERIKHLTLELDKCKKAGIFSRLGNIINKLKNYISL